MTPFFIAEDVKVAFEARFHFGWYAHGRQAKLGAIGAAIEKSFHEVTGRRNYHVLEHEIEPCVLRALLSLTPYESPAEVTRYVAPPRRPQPATKIQEIHPHCVRRIIQV
jgi:hypothetical protein